MGAVAAMSPTEGHDIIVEIYDGLDISMRCVTCRERIAVRPESAAASLHELCRLAEDHSRAAPTSPAPAPQVRDRYWLCGDDCTTDCGACKGTGPR